MKNLFVPLDIFRKTMENKDINTELEAWLTFLSTDDPEQIYNLIRKFPMFKEMYEDFFFILFLPNILFQRSSALIFFFS